MHDNVQHAWHRHTRFVQAVSCAAFEMNCKMLALPFCCRCMSTAVSAICSLFTSTSVFPLFAAGMGIQAEEAERVLESVGFNTEMRQKAIASLSGGWKMKLALGTLTCCVEQLSIM